MIEIRLAPEPRGPAYRALVEFVAARCACASLAVRRDAGSSPRLEDVLKSLRPSVAFDRDATSWPGTQLSGITARLVTFGLGPLSVRVLAAASEGLFDWRQPELPEDLCAYRSDGSCLLASVSREGNAWLELTADEARSLPPALAPARR